jgi:hypothetical protein
MEAMPVAVAVAADGSILLTGAYQGTIDFGTGALASAGPVSGFVAKLDSAGNPVFARSFGGTQGGAGTSLAVDGNGNAYVTGYADQTDFGGGVIGSAGLNNLFVVELDPAGTPIWSNAFGALGPYLPYLALDASANVILVGEATDSSLDFGGGPLPPGSVFFAKLASDGSYVSSKTFGAAGAYATPYAVAVGPAGEIVFAGQYWGTVDFGDGPLPPSYLMGGGAAFVVKLTDAGALVFSKGTGMGVSPICTGSDAKGVAVNASGEIYVFGDFCGTIDLGGGPVWGHVIDCGQGGDMYVAKLAPSGALSYLHDYGGVSNPLATAVALDPSGAPYVGGFYLGTFDFGNGPLPVTPPYIDDAFLAKLAP